MLIIPQCFYINLQAQNFTHCAICNKHYGIILMSLHSSLICMRIFLNLDVLYPKQFQTVPEKTIKFHVVKRNRNMSLGNRQIETIKTALSEANITCGKQSRTLLKLGRAPATQEARTTVGSNAKRMNLHISDASYFAFDVLSCWSWVQPLG